MIPESLARIFFRNSINIALPVMVCPGVSAAFKDGEELEVDIDSGVVKNLTKGKSLKAEALPPNIQDVLKQGGLVEVTKAKLAAKAPSCVRAVPRALIPCPKCRLSAPIADYVVKEMLFDSAKPEVRPHTNQRKDDKLVLIGRGMLSILTIRAAEQRITTTSIGRRALEGPHRLREQGAKPPVLGRTRSVALRRVPCRHP